jgi:RNA polymerase sigma-70 factor (ECF subfamily)
MNRAEDPLRPARKRLLGLAYRMLGSHADADDILQEAYLRFSTAAGGISNPQGYLTTIVTRLCIDRMKSAACQREIYVGPWLPEPIADAELLSLEAATELADDVSVALMLALERLNPAERAAFILHDVFDLEFNEIATILEKSSGACRQLASRARRAMRQDKPHSRPSKADHERLLKAFGKAVVSGDVGAVAALLRQDAILLADGGGKVVTAINPIVGPDRIARYFIGASRKFGQGGDIQAVLHPVNGALSVCGYRDGEIVQIMMIECDIHAISAVYIVSNPDKLAAFSSAERSRR